MLSCLESESFALAPAQVEQLGGLQHMHIPPGQTYVSPGEAYVEGDASSASYFLAGAVWEPSTIFVQGFMSS